MRMRSGGERDREGSVCERGYVSDFCGVGCVQTGSEVLCEHGHTCVRWGRGETAEEVDAPGVDETVWLLNERRHRRLGGGGVGEHHAKDVLGASRVGGRWCWHWGLSELTRVVLVGVVVCVAGLVWHRGRIGPVGEVCS